MRYAYCQAFVKSYNMALKCSYVHSRVHVKTIHYSHYSADISLDYVPHASAGKLV